MIDYKKDLKMKVICMNSSKFCHGCLIPELTRNDLIK